MTLHTHRFHTDWRRDSPSKPWVWISVKKHRGVDGPEEWMTWRTDWIDKCHGESWPTDSHKSTQRRYCTWRCTVVTEGPVHGLYCLKISGNSKSFEGPVLNCRDGTTYTTHQGYNWNEIISHWWNSEQYICNFPKFSFSCCKIEFFKFPWGVPHPWVVTVM